MDFGRLLDAVVGVGVGVGVGVLLPGTFPQIEYACLGVDDSIGAVVFGCAASLLLVRAALALNGLLIRLSLLISWYILYAMRLDFIAGRCFFFTRQSNNLSSFPLLEGSSCHQILNSTFRICVSLLWV